MAEDLLEQLTADLGLDNVSFQDGTASSTSAYLQPTKKTNSLNSAARYKRHRQKKKEEQKKVYSDNCDLKKEQLQLKEKLCELQYEVQALRGNGVMDLSKENELLKAEIKRHRVYIDRVVSVALGTPLELKDIGTIRMMKSGVESAVAQAIGLAYSSVNSPSWTKVAPIRMPMTEEHRKLYDIPDMYLFYQRLPFGATKPNVLRLNFRGDIIGMPIAMDELCKVCWHCMTDVSAVTERCNVMNPFASFTVREVYPKTQLSENEEVMCLAVQGVLEGKKKEVVFVLGSKDVEVSPMAFLDNNGKEFTKVKVLVQTCCNVSDGVQDVEYPVDRVEAVSIEGYILRDCGNGKASVTNIYTDPCSGWFSDLFSTGQDPIGDDGAVTSDFMDFLRFEVETLLKHISHVNQ